jgi:BCCT, betaine/carnitine/choline family transporter
MDEPHNNEKKKRNTHKHHKEDGDTTTVSDVLSSVDPTRSDEERLERRRARAKKKLAAHMAALGLDENGQPLDNFCLLKYPVREWKFTLPCSQEPVAVNPVVALIGVACLWALVIWTTGKSTDCSTDVIRSFHSSLTIYSSLHAVDPIGAVARLVNWQADVTTAFTWFYQLTNVIMFLFMMYITYHYGHIHLGQRKDRPEYANATYFCMLFAANVGSSLRKSWIQISRRIGHVCRECCVYVLGYRELD